MDVYHTRLKAGITRTKEFERKRLAAFAVNVGTKCGHDCAYCSSGALLRMHASFQQAGRSPFERDFAIVDPDTPGRVARDARRLRHRGMVQLCTTVDAWSPEAQQHDLGRRCLLAILAEPGWTVRILTKKRGRSERLRPDRALSRPRPRRTEPYRSARQRGCAGGSGAPRLDSRGAHRRPARSA